MVLVPQENFAGTVGATLFEHLEFFHVKMSYKIECCGNKTDQVIQNHLPNGTPCRIESIYTLIQK